MPFPNIFHLVFLLPFAGFFNASRKILSGLVLLAVFTAGCVRAHAASVVGTPEERAVDTVAADQGKAAAATHVPEPDASLSQSPQNAALEARADALVRQQHTMEAIHLYEAISAPSALVLNKLGMTYEKMRLYDAAKINFERAVSAGPKFSGPENNLGTVYYATGDYRRAEQHYKRALKLEPRNASIYNNLGTLYLMRRKIHKGMEAYQQAQSLDPNIFQRSAENRITTEGSRETRALINFYLAETCAEAGMKEAAMTYLQRAIDAGFNDRAKLREDRHFAALRETPAFRNLLIDEARVDTVIQPVQ